MKHSIGLSVALILPILLAVALLSGCTAVSSGEDLKAGLSADSGYSIEITGGTEGPVTLTYSDIVALGLVKKDKVAHPDASGVTVTDDYVGVPLLKVIEKAGIPPGEHAYNVTGPDGYCAVYDQAKAENATIALKKNGKALADSGDDPITLVLPGGPFCHWIASPARIAIVDAAEGEEPMDMSGHDMMNMSGNDMSESMPPS